MTYVYRMSSFKDTIEEVELIKETPHFVTIRDKFWGTTKTKKSSHYHKYFHSPEECIEDRRKVYHARVTSLENQLIYARAARNRFNDKYPMEVPDGYLQNKSPRVPEVPSEPVPSV